MAKRISFLVHGRVQGVFFRNFTQQKASGYGLTGFVRNASDGTVRGEAQGDEDALRKFRKDLEDGPKYAHVVQLEVDDIEMKPGESDFSVTRGRGEL